MTTKTFGPGTIHVGGEQYRVLDMRVHMPDELRRPSLDPSRLNVLKKMEYHFTVGMDKNDAKFERWTMRQLDALYPANRKTRKHTKLLLRGTLRKAKVLP